MNSTSNDLREVWQRGPVEGVPSLLQPVAHALLQAVEDAERYTADLDSSLLWERPAGVASPGFHLVHMRGVMDRLFTYARGGSLSPEQMEALKAEKEMVLAASAHELVSALRIQVENALNQLRNTQENILTEGRALGRKQIPTTVMGLLFHTAEHCQRHVGQLLVTVRILQAGRDRDNLRME